MATRHQAAGGHTNRLLGMLSRKDYQRLRPHLRHVPLTYRQSLYRAHRRLGSVYFIETGVGSLVNTMANGQAAEVGTIGNEGVVGLPLLLGEGSAPTSVYVQVPGNGLCMSAARFSAELAKSASMQTVMLRYAHALFNQVAQSAACNHFHTLQWRCCRWLLMTRDRMQSDEFLLTQEFLAMMLGVQRTGVSAAAGDLQRAGLIRYSRGIVTILDRRGLQALACECYGLSKREFDRLLGDAPRHARRAALRGRSGRRAAGKRVESDGRTEDQMRHAINALRGPDIADRVTSVLARRLHVHDDRIAEAATFEGDLGATSLDMVEVIMSLEDEFRIEISDRDSEGLRTVGDVVALIRTKLH